MLKVRSVTRESSRMNREIFFSNANASVLSATWTDDPGMFYFNVPLLCNNKKTTTHKKKQNKTLSRVVIPGKTQSEQIFLFSAQHSSAPTDNPKPFCVKVKLGATTVIVQPWICCSKGRNVGQWRQNKCKHSWIPKHIFYIYNLFFSSSLQFPYPAPPPQEPAKTLRSLINIRKDTLRLVRYTPDRTGHYTAV